MLKLFLGLMISIPAYCLEAMPLTALSQDASLQFNLSSPIGVPVHSKATFGAVQRKSIAAPVFNTTLFVIGGDAASIQWLEKHAQELKEKQALGFITNVNEFKIIIALQRRYQLPLLPVNVDPLLHYLHETHYPLILDGKELWQ